MTEPATAYAAAYLAVLVIAFALLAVASQRYPAPSRKGPATVTSTPAFTAADERAFALLLSRGPSLLAQLQRQQREQAETPDPPAAEPEPDEDDDDGTTVHVCVRTPDGATVEASAWLPRPATVEETAAAVRRCSAGVLAQLAPPATPAGG